MQVATVPVQICMGTVACAYNFLTIFSLSLYLTLSSLSLSLSGAELSFSSSHQSFFLFHQSPPPLINLSSLFLVVFGLNGLDHWVLGWMGLNVSCHRHRHRHRLPLDVSILFLVLAIATRGVNVNRLFCFSFLPSPPEASILLLKARRQSW